MGHKRKGDATPQPMSFRPRRTVAPVGNPDEERVVVRAYMPKSLAKDISLYALERDCSVSDLLNTILRKAIPPLKVVSVAERLPISVQLESTLPSKPDSNDGGEESNEDDGESLPASRAA